MRHTPNFGLERIALTESGNQATYRTTFNKRQLILEVQFTEREGETGALLTEGKHNSFLPQRHYPKKTPQELMERAVIEYLGIRYAATEPGC